LITRLRYQLFKRQKDWNWTQKNRWETIQELEEFEEIIFSYEIVSDLFNIFDEEKNALSFQEWFSKFSTREEIIEMQNSWRMIQNHLVRIIHILIINLLMLLLSDWTLEFKDLLVI